MPGAANFFSQTPGLRRMAKWIGGIAQQRDMPPFAPETFQAWFRRRAPRNQGNPPVILWPDTFNNYFHPEVAKAAVEVLEAAGFQVLVPQAPLCCGRPLYDFGMLDTAKAGCTNILDTLRPQIQAGIPLVGLEPSCLAVFRDELLEMFPHQKDAQQLHDQSFLLSEFLEKKAANFRYPQLNRKALVWGHCHHRSVMGMTAEEAVLKKMGMDCQLAADATCCGMAGSFGFEPEHVEVANQIGELGALPKVRQAEPNTIVVADGFSCQTMIEQGRTGRQALHLAQVLQMALHEGPDGPPADQLPESGYPKLRRAITMASTVGLTAIAAGLGVGMIVFSYVRNRRISGVEK